MIFLTSHNYIRLLFICFLHCAKESIVVEISKVSQPLEKSLPSCKCGRKCKNKFFNQSLLHPVIFQKRKLQIFGSSFISCSLQWRGWLHYECVRISALNTTLDIYLRFENGHKSTQTMCKVCSNLTKCTTTNNFRLTSVFFINLEDLSDPTLVLLFIL